MVCVGDFCVGCRDGKEACLVVFECRGMEPFEWSPEVCIALYTAHIIQTTSISTPDSDGHILEIITNSDDSIVVYSVIFTYLNSYIMLNVRNY